MKYESFSHHSLLLLFFAGFDFGFGSVHQANDIGFVSDDNEDRRDHAEYDDLGLFTEYDHPDRHASRRNDRRKGYVSRQINNDCPRRKYDRRDGRYEHRDHAQTCRNTAPTLETEEYRPVVSDDRSDPTENESKRHSQEIASEPYAERTFDRIASEYQKRRILTECTESVRCSDILTAMFSEIGMPDRFTQNQSAGDRADEITDHSEYK